MAPHPLRVRSRSVQQFAREWACLANAKKNPSAKLGLQAYLLSHIKAPLREEKREVANHPPAIYQTLAKVSSPYP